MKFKELFDNAFLITEAQVKKGLKIFYEIKLNLIKPTEEKKEQSVQQPAQQPASAEVPTQSVEQPIEQVPSPEQPPVQSVTEPTQQTSNNEIGANLGEIPLPSVYTEDEVSVNDENKIIRKFEGSVRLSKSQKDNIQSFEDIIDALKDHKKNGEEILDDFCVEVITLCSNQNFNELKTKIDKKSKIFVEIYYGFEKDDSVGVRFNKRENSDTLTSTMLIDNEIVSARFSIDKINQKIASYRNYEANKK